MSSPISFPTLQAPQVAPPRRGQLDGFAELLASIQDRRQQRQIAREGLDLERQRTESSLETDKLQRAKMTRDQDIADRRLQASDAVDRYVAEALQDPHLSPVRLSDIRARMVRENDKSLSPFLNEAFDTEFQAQQKTLQGVAERQTAEVGARVAGATEKPVIASAQTAAKRADVELSRAGVELNTAKIQQHLAEVEQTYGAARGAIAGEVLRGGGTLGQAYRIIGVPVHAGVDPNFKVEKPAGAGGEAQRKLEGTAGLVTLGNSWIEAAGDPDISKLGAVIRRGGTVGGLLEILASSKLSQAERQAIAGYRMLGEGFALYVTGQQASAGQVDRLVGVISKQPGETGASAQTRSLLRQAVVDLIQNAAAGGSPSEGMAEIVKLAKSRNADAQTIATLQAFAQDSKKFETTRRAKTGAAAPPDAIDPAVARRAAANANRPPR